MIILAILSFIMAVYFPLLCYAASDEPRYMNRTWNDYVMYFGVFFLSAMFILLGVMILNC